MSPESFCYWLHGYMELTSEYKGLTADQVKIIEDHLDLVFQKLTPAQPTLPPCPTEQPGTPCPIWPGTIDNPFTFPPHYPTSTSGGQLLC